MPQSRSAQRLAPPQVAALLGISERTLDRWVQKGRFPKPIKFGSARHWEQPTVDAWIYSARSESMK